MGHFLLGEGLILPLQQLLIVIFETRQLSPFMAVAQCPPSFEHAKHQLP
jgi:hypothetical protein